MRIGNRKSQGFSLVELLTVMAIIALLVALAVPAFQSVALGSSLSRGGEIAADQLALARQLAVSRNSQVQVRMVRLPDEPAGYRAFQLWGQGTNLTDFVPLTRLTVLPEGVSLASNATLSPLLNDPALTTFKTNGIFPGKGALEYCGFRFKPGGGTDLPFNATNAFLTVVYARDGGATALPPNHCIIQIDPVSGRAKTYRP
ncbi:MAG: Verru_Chthon cassette protein D [Terrimicrobiaceae bacterium]